MNLKVLQRSIRRDGTDLLAQNIEADIKVQTESIQPIKEATPHPGTMMEDLIAGHLMLPIIRTPL